MTGREGEGVGDSARWNNNTLLVSRDHTKDNNRDASRRCK